MATNKLTFPPNPSTERGKSTVIHGNDKKGRLTYGSERQCVFRSIEGFDCGQYHEHAGQLVTVASTDNTGNWIASGDATGTVRIWAPDNADRILKLEIQALSGAVCDIAWNSENNRVLAVGEGKQGFAKVFMWDSGSSVGDITGHSKKINSGSFKPTRPFRLATASEDQQVNFFQGPPFKLSCGIRDHKNFVNVVRYAPNGEMFATGSSDRTIHLYEGKEGTHIDQLGSHEGSVFGIAWKSDSTQLVSVGGDKVAKVWDVESKTVNRTLTIGDGKLVEDMLVGVVWVKDTIIALALSGDLYHFVGDEVTPSRCVSGHQRGVVEVAFDESSQRIFSADSAGRVCAWNTTDGSLGRVKDSKPSSVVTSVSSLSASAGKVVFGLNNNVVNAVEADALVNGDKNIKLSFKPVSSAPIPKDDGLFIHATTKSVAVLRVGDSVELVGETPLDLGSTINCLAISADGLTVALGLDDGNVVVLDRNDGSVSEPKEKFAVDGRKAVRCLSFSPSGDHLVCGDHNGNLTLFDLNKHEVLEMRWKYHNSGVSAVAWKDNETIVSGGRDGNIITWKTSSKSPASTTGGAHFGGVSSLCFAGEDLVTGGADGAVKVWTLN